MSDQQNIQAGPPKSSTIATIGKCVLAAVAVGFAVYGVGYGLDSLGWGGGIGESMMDVAMWVPEKVSQGLGHVASDPGTWFSHDNLKGAAKTITSSFAAIGLINVLQDMVANQKGQAAPGQHTQRVLAERQSASHGAAMHA